MSKLSKEYQECNSVFRQPYAYLTYLKMDILVCKLLIHLENLKEVEHDGQDLITIIHAL